MIPDKSVISIKDGVWFVYADGRNSIKVHCSNLGKEKIYLNGNLVSEKRNLKTNHEHVFEDEIGTKYKIKFAADNLLKGMECYIFREKDLIKVFKTKYISAKKRSLVLYLPTIIFALIIEIFNYSRLYLIFSIVIGVILHFMINGSGKMVIEESNAIA